MRKLQLGLLIIAIFAICVNRSFADSADEILKEYGRKKGLCVVLGAGSNGNGDLCYQLAAKSDMIIHGIATTLQTKHKARGFAEKNNLIGQIQIEQIELNPLPYVDNLINLLIIEDISILEKIDKKEIQRVVAPYGLIFKKEKGKWEFNSKKRLKSYGTWLHPSGDYGWNRTTTDEHIVSNPGVHWQDGLPINFNGWAACRGYVVNEQYCFSLGSTEFENLNFILPKKTKKDEYLVARDAYSGLPLWKINCKTQGDGGALSFRNQRALVADSNCVYAYKEGSIIAVEGETGNIEKKFSVSYPTVKMLLKDNILVVAGWEKKENYALWNPYIIPTNNGKVEVFDTVTGKKMWSIDGPCQDILISNNKLFVMMHSWGQRPGRKYKLKVDDSIKTTAIVYAYDLKTGKELWKSEHENFRNDVDPWMCCAGEGIVAVIANYNQQNISVISTETGNLLWDLDCNMKEKTPVYIRGRAWAVVVNKKLWISGKMYELKTGKYLGDAPVKDITMCSAFSISKNTAVTGKNGKIVSMSNGKLSVLGAGRGGCIEGFALANGLYYTAQNSCSCVPQQIPGFIGLGNVRVPQKKDFIEPKEVIKGNSYGKITDIEIEKTAYPIFLGNSERTNFVSEELSNDLKVNWKTKIIKKQKDTILNIWRDRNRSNISAPVTGYGKVFCVGIDEGKIVALNPDNGKIVWTFYADARVDSPPTLYNGMVLFGCRNGWIYALNVNDGDLVWKTRIAPIEQRMIAFGQIESSFPILGSVLVHNGIVYASGGKTTESNNGGLVATALNCKTGKQIWSCAISAINQPKNSTKKKKSWAVSGNINRQNDLLLIKDGKLRMRQVSMNLNDGNMDIVRDGSGALEGIGDGVWTRQHSKRSGNINIGQLRVNMCAIDKDFIYGIIKQRKDWTLFAMELSNSKKVRNKYNSSLSKWTYKLKENRLFKSLLKYGDKLIIGGSSLENNKRIGFIMLINSSDGSVIKETKLDIEPIFQGISVLNNQIFIALENGTLIKIK